MSVVCVAKATALMILHEIYHVRGDARFSSRRLLQAASANTWRKPHSAPWLVTNKIDSVRDVTLSIDNCMTLYSRHSSRANAQWGCNGAALGCKGGRHHASNPGLPYLLRSRILALFSMASRGSLPSSCSCSSSSLLPLSPPAKL